MQCNFSYSLSLSLSASLSVLSDKRAHTHARFNVPHNAPLASHNTLTQSSSRCGRRRSHEAQSRSLTPISSPIRVSKPFNRACTHTHTRSFLQTLSLAESALLSTKYSFVRVCAILYFYHHFRVPIRPEHGEFSTSQVLLRAHAHQRVRRKRALSQLAYQPLSNYV